MKRFTDRYVFAFDVDPERMWRAVADTDALNRDAGLPPVTYRYEPRRATTSATVASARAGPFALEWHEPAFVWEAPRRLAIDRHFRRGPFAAFRTEIRVEPHEIGTRVQHDVELEADGIGALLAPLVMWRAGRGAARAYERAAERARRAPLPEPARESVPDVAPASAERTARFVDALAPVRPALERGAEVAARLASLVEHGEDAALARMRPYVLADAWGLPREQTLAAMLAATRAGLLDLQWTIVCPSCRGPKNAVQALAQLGAAVHCDACGIAYDAHFDRNVEVTFDARPSGRATATPVYCLAGPHTAQQTLGQTPLEPAQTRTLDLTLPPGAYVVQALPDRAARLVVEDDAGAGSVEVRLDDRGVRLASAVARAGRVRLTVVNAGGASAVVRVTEAELSDQLATAADVTALQCFRDLFSSEILAEGIELEVRSLAVVFSDIVGSTALYATGGDARAFRLVREHFEALHDVVARRRGAIVKTIGDAVMAVFVDPQDAVAAALAFNDAVAPLQLRIGIHRGPCIAMRANDRLDYFGGTVNVASRVAHAAGAGEVLVTDAVADDPRVADALPDGDRGTLTLRGIPEPIGVVRVSTTGRETVPA